MSGTLVSIVISLVGALFALGWATRSALDRREPVRWARAFGVTVTANNRAMVTYYVALVAVLRVIGGLGGLIIGLLFDQAFGADTTAGGGTWVWVIVGWMIGSWRADRAVATGLEPRSGAGASLTSRRLRDYLPRGLLVAPAALALVAVAVAGASIARDSVADSDRVGLATAALAAVLVAAGATAAQRRVIARPQPADQPDRVSADDGIRANTVHHLGGGAAAAVGFLLAEVLWASGLGAGGSLMAFLGLGATLYGWIAWRFSAFRAWRVQRDSGPQALHAAGTPDGPAPSPSGSPA